MAGVRFLQSRREVDPSRIGVFGISQGTCVVTIAAAGSTDVRLVIRLSGYGVPGDEMKIEQIRLLTHALGEDRYSALEPATAWNRELYRLCETDDTVSEIRDGMKRWEAERQKEAKPLPHHNSDRALDKLLSYAATPLMRSTLRYDPRVDLRRLKVN
jgi:dienelactone hydrolase